MQALYLLRFFSWMD